MKQPGTEQIVDLLHTHKLKATKGRVAVYGVLNEYGHASADMILERIRTDFPEVTVATVYNVLESFVKCGLVARRLSQGTRMLFDVNNYEHVHLYDSESGALKDYDDSALVQLVKDYLAGRNIDGFKMESVDIQLIGRFEHKY